MQSSQQLQSQLQKKKFIHSQRTGTMNSCISNASDWLWTGFILFTLYGDNSLTGNVYSAYGKWIEVQDSYKVETAPYISILTPLPETISVAYCKDVDKEGIIQCVKYYAATQKIVLRHRCVNYRQQTDATWPYLYIAHRALLSRSNSKFQNSKFQFSYKLGYLLILFIRQLSRTAGSASELMDK